MGDTVNEPETVSETQAEADFFDYDTESDEEITMMWTHPIQLPVLPDGSYTPIYWNEECGAFDINPPVAKRHY